MKCQVIGRTISGSLPGSSEQEKNSQRTFLRTNLTYNIFICFNFGCPSSNRILKSKTFIMVVVDQSFLEYHNVRPILYKIVRNYGSKTTISMKLEYYLKRQGCQGQGFVNFHPILTVPNVKFKQVLRFFQYLQL